MIKIGTVIGAFNTILATLLTAAVGLYFVRLQGISTLFSAANTIRNNQEPLKEIFNGFCLISGTHLAPSGGHVGTIFGPLGQIFKNFGTLWAIQIRPWRSDPLRDPF